MSEQKNLRKEKRLARKKAFYEKCDKIPVVRWMVKDMGLKALSLFFAVIVWAMVISQANPTRAKMVYDVPVEITGITTLNSRDLALDFDINELPSFVDVRVEVPMDDLSRVTANNVTAAIDFSRITSVGEYELRLTLDSTYGAAVSASVESVRVDIESQTTSAVPVQIVSTGDPSENVKLGKITVSPTQFQITGPETSVSQVAYALVNVDLEGLSTDFSRSVFYTLMDEEGNPVDDTNLSASVGDAVSVSIPVYPIKEIPLLSDASVIGKVEEGYELQSVMVSPSTVMVAAKQDVLDDLTGLTISAVNVTGATESFLTTANVRVSSDIFWTDVTQVDVLATVTEMTESKTFYNVPIRVRNLGEGLSAVLSVSSMNVEVTLPVSKLENFTIDDITLYVDLNGYTAASNESVPVSVSLNTMAENKTCTPESDEVKVTVTKAAR